MKNNLLKLLIDKNIQYRDNGEWIQVCNPWVNDRKYHLGINVDRDFFNCFKTNMTGTVVEFVMQLEKCDREEAKKLLGEKTIEDYKRQYKLNLAEERQKRLLIEAEKVNLPDGSIELRKKPGMMRAYHFALAKLGDERLVEAGKFFLGTRGNWKDYLIMPYYQQGIIVYYIGRNLDLDGKMRYLYPSNKDTGKYKSDFIYNIDNASRKVLIVCEGGFNSIVASGIGLGGKTISVRQVEKIVEIKPKKVIVALDQDKYGRQNTKKVCESLINYGLDVSFFWLDDATDKDFADIGRQKTLQLLKQFTYPCSTKNFLKIQFT